MSMIHDPVDIYQKYLQKKVDFFLKSLTPNECFFRLNWSIVTNVKDKYDMYTPLKNTSNHIPHTISNVYFRVERQTFRKLSKSQMICFGIKTYQRPMSHFKGKSIESLKFLESLNQMEKSHKIFKN